MTSAPRDKTGAMMAPSAPAMLVGAEPLPAVSEVGGPAAGVPVIATGLFGGPVGDRPTYFATEEVPPIDREAPVGTSIFGGDVYSSQAVSHPLAKQTERDRVIERGLRWLDEEATGRHAERVVATGAFGGPVADRENELRSMAPPEAPPVPHEAPLGASVFGSEVYASQAVGAKHPKREGPGPSNAEELAQRHIERVLPPSGELDPPDPARATARRPPEEILGACIFGGPVADQFTDPYGARIEPAELQPVRHEVPVGVGLFGGDVYASQGAGDKWKLERQMIEERGPKWAEAASLRGAPTAASLSPNPTISPLDTREGIQELAHLVAGVATQRLGDQGELVWAELNRAAEYLFRAALAIPARK